MAISDFDILNDFEGMNFKRAVFDEGYIKLYFEDNNYIDFKIVNGKNGAKIRVDKYIIKKDTDFV